MALTKVVKLNSFEKIMFKLISRSIVFNYLKKATYARNRFFVFQYIFLLSACGKSSDEDRENTPSIDYIGIADDYVPPPIAFDQPTKVDPHFKALEPSYDLPYWVEALSVDDAQDHISLILSQNNAKMNYSFPSTEPYYNGNSILLWSPASTNMKKAGREIFSELNKVLHVQFEEVEIHSGSNLIAIAQSQQNDTAGFSYLPNPHFEIGSDVFISKNYSNPIFVSNTLTNYDYEILLHEIGHAIGLKHPFETQGDNTQVLDPNEDSTKFTAMSYNEDLITFDGKFRALDLLTLTKFYGVNKSYKSQDDTYLFSSNGFSFIVDGGGVDVIDSSSSQKNAYIDLRPGSHSYLSEKSEYITSINQLTISHGSEIENVFTGLGDDTVIGNELENYIVTGAGDDRIFLGEAADKVYAGQGHNIIDLSEISESFDRIIAKEESISQAYNQVYGFTQGIDGDVYDLSDCSKEGLVLLPVILKDNVPSGYISNHILRLVGENLHESALVSKAFNNDLIFQNLILDTNANIFILTSDTQNTGYDQNLFMLNYAENATSVTKIAKFVGNNLDIDMWTIDNFIATDIVTIF